MAFNMEPHCTLTFRLRHLQHDLANGAPQYTDNYIMKGSPCCAGLMRSCLHTYRTKTNLTQHIIQPWGGHQASMGRGGHQPTMGGPSAKYGGAISQVWGGHQPSMGGAISQVWGGHQPTLGGPSAKYGGGIYFPTSMYRKSKSTELL